MSARGICRTCLAPIWNEGGTVGHRKRDEGWSDRIERGGDSLVCFKAIGYRHVPLADPDRHQSGPCEITTPGLCVNSGHDHATWPPMTAGRERDIRHDRTEGETT